MSVIDPVPGWWRDRWSDLPLISKDPVMTDDDTEYRGDWLYLRGLLDFITDECAELRARVREAFRTDVPVNINDVWWLQYFTRNAELLTHWTFEFSEPWPEDEAAAMLAAWNESRTEAA